MTEPSTPTMENAALTLLLILRTEARPMTLQELGNKSLFRDSVIIDLLVELSSNGPVVAIDIAGKTAYALEWGVKHRSELH